MRSLNKYLKAIREGGLTVDIIKKIVDESIGERNARLKKYERYKASKQGVPIFSRKYDIEPITDQRINNDFFGEIIDVKTGYFAGKAAAYAYDKQVPEFKKASELLSNFQVINSLSDLDAETTKDCAICGVAYRLCYVDPEGTERVMMLKPYEIVALYENEPNFVEYAFRIYQEEKKTRVEFYDSKMISVYESSDDGYSLIDERPHLFDYCPVIMYINNNEMQGDADKVLPLIDAYDITLSDMNSEISALRLAYLAFIGGDIDEEGLKMAQETGAFKVPEGGDVRFIIKQWDDAVIEHHLDRIESNIYRFSKTPNLNDKQFSGNSSGVALKYKLSGIESKCSAFERKKLSSDMQMFKVIASAWTKKRETFDPMRVIIEHKRNVPIDMLEIADAVTKFKGIVSDQTLLSLLPFVDDPEYELELIQQDIDLMGGDLDGEGTARALQDIGTNGEKGDQSAVN